MSANVEVVPYTSHALDFRHEGVAVKAAAGLLGSFMKIIMPQPLSANYHDIDRSIPFIEEALFSATVVEAVGFMIVVASALASKDLHFANTINLAPIIAIDGAAIYGMGRAMSLWIEMENRYPRKNKTETSPDLASWTRSLFTSPDSEIICGQKDVAWIFPKNAAEAAAATGLHLDDETVNATHIFEFKVKKTEMFKEDATVHNFAGFLLHMFKEKDCFAVAPDETHAITFYAILGRFDRHRKIYEKLGFEKKAELEKGQSVWVLNPAKLAGISPA